MPRCATSVAAWRSRLRFVVVAVCDAYDVCTPAGDTQVMHFFDDLSAIDHGILDLSLLHNSQSAK